MAWGKYYNGSTFVPVFVPPGLTNAVAIAGGAGHSLALLEDGTVAVWGFNYYGQTNVPLGLDRITAIAAGEYFNLALRGDGTVIAWGEYYNGSGIVPMSVPDGITNVVAIAAGAGHGLALQSGGSVVAWGDDSFGQTDVPSSLSNAVAISAGPYSCLALQADGSVITWGQFYSGTNFIPFFVPSWLTNATGVSAGNGHALALERGGAVVAWGDDTYGQTNVPLNLTNAVSVAAGGNFSLALRADTTVRAWGSNLNGQTNIPSNATNIVQIAAGYYHALALQAAGPVIWSNQVSTLALAPGANAALSVAAAAPGAISAQWFLNGSPIAGATGTSLVLTNFALAEAGAYSVQLSDASGAITRLVGVLRLTNSPVVQLDGVDAGGGPVMRVDTTQVVMSTTFGSNATMYYTLDGSDPDFTAIPYLGPFTLSNSCSLRAIAYNSTYSAWAEAAPLAVQIWPTYSLDVFNAGGGTVTVVPFPYAGDNHYLSNSVVTLTAAALDGWTFLGWAGDIIAESNVVSFPLNRPTEVQAVFGTSLNLFTNGPGSIMAEPPVGPYPYGSTVQLTALPGPGGYFFGWGGAASGTDNPITIETTNASGITALFGSLKANQVALTVLRNGSGQVSVSPATRVFTNGDIVMLTAIPDTNSLFIGWTGDVTNSQNPLSLQLNGSLVITANFLSQQSTNPPSIIQQPMSVTASPGSEVVFSVQVAGVPPLTYQWQLNGLPLAGATAPDLLLPNVTGSDAGLYNVVVTGLGGTVTSGGALLGIFGMQITPGSSGLLPLLHLDGAPGSNYLLEFTDDLTAAGWQPLSSVSLTSGHYEYIDEPITNHSRRFYRAIPQ